MSPADLKPYELLQRAADFFEREHVPYRIVGSMASIAYGEARLTNDIDVLVDMTENIAEAVGVEFPAPEFYVSVPAVREAVRCRRPFKIIHIPSGLKLDIIQRPDTKFGRIDIADGQRLKSEGSYDAWFGSPENVILMKLRYYQEGGSDKHLRDIAGTLLVQDQAINREYISEWAKELGVSTEWQLMLDRLKDNLE